jgi:hypothetical protein
MMPTVLLAILVFVAYGSVAVGLARCSPQTETDIWGDPVQLSFRWEDGRLTLHIYNPGPRPAKVEFSIMSASAARPKSQRFWVVRVVLALVRWIGERLGRQRRLGP